MSGRFVPSGFVPGGLAAVYAAGAVGAVRTVAGRGIGCGKGSDRGEFVREEFLDFVEAGDGEGTGDFGVGRGGADAKDAVFPFDDGVFVAFPDTAVNDGVPDGEFEFANFAVAVDAASVFELACGKRV
ncbi:MAG: hypothetical protein LBM04_06710 [Opitutaceae bacterium]|nr:hypothetical protein [Opitutaceae bacterium]